MKTPSSEKPRHSHGASLEAYLVFAVPIPSHQVQNPLPDCQVEIYPDSSTHTRAMRLYGDVSSQTALVVLRDLLDSGQVRWLELGMRGYALMEGKREYRPWRANKHLSRATFLELAHLELEVRYHAPI
jgi:hypothetical protein